MLWTAQNFLVVKEDLNRVEIEDEKLLKMFKKELIQVFITQEDSPQKRKGVHHFHCLISEFINHK